MRVVVVTHSPSPYQVELFDRISADNGISLTVIYLFEFDPNRLWRKRASHHAHFLHGSDVELGLAKLADQADLLVINYYQHKFALALLNHRARAAKLWVFWGERPGSRNRLLGRFARRWYLRSLHSSKAPIWGIGHFALDAYRREFTSERMFVNLPYFSDLKRFEPVIEETRQREARTILFSGSLIPRKGTLELANAFVEAARQQPNLRLHILGTGPEAEELSRVLAPVIEQVEFLGFRDWDDLPAEYAKADILCVPSRYDGWGLVVPEGLAAGLPVISTTQTGAALDLICHGVNGWLIQPQDASSLANLLLQVALMDDKTLSQMSSAARASVAAHGLESGAQRFIDAAYAAVTGWGRT